MRFGSAINASTSGATARAMRILLGTLVFLVAGIVGMQLRERSSAERPSHAELEPLMARVRAALEKGRYAEIGSLLRSVPEDHPFAAEARFLEGRAQWKLNRWNAAERLWKRALQLDPRVPQAGWHLLRFYYVQQRLREAEQLALDLYVVEPDPRDQTLLLLELVRMEHERLTPAETAIMLEPVIALEPDNYHALRTVGLSYVQLGRATEGLDLIERAIRLQPAENENWYVLTWSLYETGYLNRLEAIWKNLPEALDNDPRMLRLHAMWTETTGNLSDAERRYREVLNRDPVDRKAHYQLARLLRARSANEEAELHEEIAIKIDLAREEMGACYMQATQQDDNPSAELCRQLSQLCRELNRPRQAELWEREAARRSSDSRRDSSVRADSHRVPAHSL